MSRRRLSIIAVAIVVLFACLNMAWGMFWLPPVPTHRGDGVFQNLSRRAGPFAIPDAQGQVVVSVSGRLGDYIWWGFSDLHVLYHLEKSFFTPDPEEEYCVRFTYEPVPRLEGFKGFVYVRCGGGK